MGGKPRPSLLDKAKAKIKQLEKELEEAHRNRRVPDPPGGGFALEPQRQTWPW